MHPVTQSCSTLCDPMDCSPPGSSVHTIFQRRLLEWVVISFSEGSSWSKDWTHIPCSFCTGRCILFCCFKFSFIFFFFGRYILYHCATWEAQGSLYIIPNLGSELGDPLRAQPDAKTFLYKETSTGCFCCCFLRLAWYWSIPTKMLNLLSWTYMSTFLVYNKAIIKETKCWQSQIYQKDTLRHLNR